MASNFYVNDIDVPVRLSFVTLTKPEKFQNGPLKYSVVCLVPKTDTKTLALLQAKAKEAMIGKFKDNPMEWPAVFRQPGMFDGVFSIDGKQYFLRDGDIAGKEMLKGQVYFKASTDAEKPPRLYMRNQQTGKIRPDVPASVFYSGCYATIRLAIAAYDRAESKGITAYVNGLCFEKDGPVIGRAAMDDNAFGEVEEEYTMGSTGTPNDDDIPF